MVAFQAGGGDVEEATDAMRVRGGWVKGGTS